MRGTTRQWLACTAAIASAPASGEAATIVSLDGDYSVPRPVATFGGYFGRAFAERPNRNGLLTCVVQGGPDKLDLFWVFPGKGQISLGSIESDSVPPGYSPF